MSKENCIFITVDKINPIVIFKLPGNSMVSHPCLLIVFYLSGTSLVKADSLVLINSTLCVCIFIDETMAFNGWIVLIAKEIIKILMDCSKTIFFLKHSDLSSFYWSRHQIVIRQFYGKASITMTQIAKILHWFSFLIDHQRYFIYFSSSAIRNGTKFAVTPNYRKVTAFPYQGTFNFRF